MVKGTDNLKCYVREAILPRMKNGKYAPAMPPDGHKSHMNTLKVRPETWRRLESIYSLDYFQLEEVIIAWIDMYLPEYPLEVEDVDEDTGETLSIPCPGTDFDIMYREERKPSDLSRLAPWVDNLALMTVQRILHLIHPGSQTWGFSLADETDFDRTIFQYYLWTVPEYILEGLDENRRKSVEYSSVVVAFQPPWVLSAQDIKEFAKCRSFPPFRESGNAFPTPLDSTHRLWAKLWDLCVRRNTPWFVLTSYNHWTFGMFSKGWTAAFISGVYEYDHHSPTITECLTFWIASAMRIAVTLRYPKVPEPVHLPPIQIIARRSAEIPDPENSESNWDGKSDEVASSAGVRRSVSPGVSDNGLPDPGPIPPAERSQEYLASVQTWMNDTIDSNYVPVDEPLYPTPHIPQGFAYFHPFDKGEWLVG
ncbi:hypothetical protein F5050DRAFT_1806143 [Lentinula boryana]|uniref:Aminotransferase-like plant mobile domain-containing protein n=1 Tax=Lentinula boryana TaxID=40481 RepID=A0ABQ8QI70_9AGAR|nr:hypothetical protein F5050DRAFT_1806143 [Lentinula boryana]